MPLAKTDVTLSSPYIQHSIYVQDFYFTSDPVDVRGARPLFALAA